MVLPLRAWSDRPALTAWGALAALACAALLASCGDGGPPPDATAEAPVYGGTLAVAAPTDLDHANALVSADAFTQEILTNVLFMTLLRYDEALEPEPYLAASYQLHGDTAVTFALRDDVFWHDGRRTSAYDVAFTYERARDPETAFPNAALYFGRWGEHEVVDSFTIRFRFEAHGEPLDGWTGMAIMPRHLLEDVPPAQLRQARFNREPVGNGPFRFVSYRSNDRWIFEANPDFPEALGGRPYVRRFVWRIIPESSAQIAALRTGAVHLVLTPPAEQVRELAADPNLRAIVRQSRQYGFVGWNGARPPFDDVRVRVALAMAMDRQGILEGLRGGYGDVAVGPVAPFHWAYDDGLEPIPFDPDGARALLAEAGYRPGGRDGTLRGPDGRPLEFSLTIPAGSDFNRDAAEKIRSDLAAIGVRMTTRPVEFATLIADVTSPERRFDAVLLAFESSLRIDLRDQFHSASRGSPFQIASYANPEVDELLDRVSVLVDRAEATPVIQRLQQLLRDEQPWTFLYYFPDMMLAHERLRGVDDMDIRGRFVSLPLWWLAE